MPAPPRRSSLTRAELERLIRAAGRVPVERDTCYRKVDRSLLPPMRAPRKPESNFVPQSSLTANLQ